MVELGAAVSFMGQPKRGILTLVLGHSLTDIETACSQTRPLSIRIVPDMKKIQTFSQM